MGTGTGVGGKSTKMSGSASRLQSNEIVPTESESSAEDAGPSVSTTTCSTPFEITGRYDLDLWRRVSSMCGGDEFVSTSRPVPPGSHSGSAVVSPNRSALPMEEALPPPTHVHVVVVAARGLRGADWTGFSDPFVEVSACGANAKRRYRTSVATQTLNPTWTTRNERFLVGCDDADENVTASASSTPANALHRKFRGISLSVFDRDWGTSSQFLGGAVIDPTQIPRGGKWVEMTLELQSELPEFAKPSGSSGKKKRPNYFGSKYAIKNASTHNDSPQNLGTITVRISAADDLSWDVRSDTGAVVFRDLTHHFKPGKFGATKAKTAAAGYRALRREANSVETAQANSVDTKTKLNPNRDSNPVPGVRNGTGHTTVATSSSSSTVMRASPSSTTRSKLTRHVHVCVVAGKHLSASDVGRSTDAFVKLSLDNGLPSEFGKTETIKRSLDPVWGRGAGETFTVPRRPGACEVVLDVYDADFAKRNQLVSTGVVPLFCLPANGSWSVDITVPLFPPLQTLSVGKDRLDGESKGFLVVRVAASSPAPRVLDAGDESLQNSVSAAAPTGSAAATITDISAPVPEVRNPTPNVSSPKLWSFWPDSPNPPPAPPGRYVNKMESSSFVYFQVCGARDLPTPREGDTTNFRASVSLNSERGNKHTDVQEDLSSDSVWVPQVFAFPRNPNAKFVTVRVYGAATKLWDPEAVSGMARSATLGFVDMGLKSGKSEKGKSGKNGADAESAALSVSSAAGAAAEGLRKKRFATGTLLGEARVRVDQLVVGAETEPVWASLRSVLTDTEKKATENKKASKCAAFRKGFDVFGKPEWLTKRGDDLGEICIAARAGRLKQPPDDLVNPSDFGSRPKLGLLEVRVLSAEGDERALDAAKGDALGWFTTKTKKQKKSPNQKQPRSASLSRWFSQSAGSASLEFEFETDSDSEVGENLRVAEEDSGETSTQTPTETSNGHHDTSRSGTPNTELNELLGTRVSARLVFEGRAERVSSPFERRTFDVTEPTAELRVLLFGEGIHDEVFLGAAVLPVSAVLGTGTVDAWLDVFGPSKENTERNLQDAEYRVRVHATKRRRGWVGRVRITASITRDKPLYQWYLRQPARHAGAGGGDSKMYIDDTIRGVICSIERVVTAVLAPITAPIAALGHCQNPDTNKRVLLAWIAWHTLLSFTTRAHLLGSFKLTWYVSGAVFIGFCAAQARGMDSAPEPYHGAKVVRSLAGDADGPKPSADDTRTGGDASTARSAVSLSTAIALPRSLSRVRSTSDTSHLAAVSEISSMGVSGFEKETKTERRRVRVQRWLKEIRIRRKHVLLEMAEEARALALQQRGKSPAAVIAMIRKTDAASRQSGVAAPGVGGVGDGTGVGEVGKTQAAKPKPGTGTLVVDDTVDEDDPIQILVRRAGLKKLAQIMSSANPAEVVMRLLQQVTWTLLMTLKSTGSTLLNVGVSLGKVHKMLAGPCRKACVVLDPIADALERLGGLLSWRDARLSKYVAVTLIAAALILSLLWRLLVFPLREFLDSNSPVRAWHVAWLVGILPCVRLTPVTKVCLKITVLCERLVQNALGALHIQPISPYTLELLERSLVTEFAEAGGTWEGMEKVIRAQETEKQSSQDQREALANLKLRDELRKGTGLNPLRWLVHAAKRAPTRVEWEHAQLVTRFVDKIVVVETR